MLPNRLLLIALGGETALALLALVWIGLRRLPLELAPPLRGLAAGTVAAGAFALMNLYLLRRAPAVAGVRSIRRLYYEVLKPLFADLRAFDVVLIGLVAGVGEELLFRGAIQPEIGVVPASLLFGAMHIGGGGTVVFGCWAALFGLALGWLAIGTGGLLAPVVAHAVYDTVALAYIRWAPDEGRIPLPAPRTQRETKSNDTSRREEPDA